MLFTAEDTRSTERPPSGTEGFYTGVRTPLNPRPEGGIYSGSNPGPHPGGPYLGGPHPGGSSGSYPGHHGGSRDFHPGPHPGHYHRPHEGHSAGQQGHLYEAGPHKNGFTEEGEPQVQEKTPDGRKRPRAESEGLSEMEPKKFAPANLWFGKLNRQSYSFYV